MYSKYGECKLTTPLQYAAIAQLVERIHGKDEVSGSNPDRGSIENTCQNDRYFLWSGMGYIATGSAELSFG